MNVKRDLEGKKKDVHVLAKPRIIGTAKYEMKNKESCNQTLRGHWVKNSD